MKSKQLPLIEKCICLNIFCQFSYKFSEVYLLLKFYYKFYFRKMALVGFQYEPVSLKVNKVCFDEEQDILNTREQSRKRQSIIE